MLFGIAPFSNILEEVMRTRSMVTNRVYEPEAMVYIKNPIQVARYMEYGCVLYDLIPDEGRLIAVFSRKETAPLYERWKAREI